MMSDPFETRVEEFCYKNRIFDGCTGGVLAVSGGPDSMAMLSFFIRRIRTFPIVVAHVNHGIRTESDSEEDGVRRFCLSNGIPIEVFHARIPETLPHGRSIEDFSREKRYSFFESVREKYGFSHIFTAHNQNDNTETFLLHLIRGCGSGGGTGISPIRPDLIGRPLLGEQKSEIVSYCERNEVPYYIDRTNSEIIYTRNRVRNVILPEIRNINPSFDLAAEHFMRTLEEDVSFLDDLADEAYARIGSYEHKSGGSFFDRLSAVYSQNNELPLSFLKELKKPVLSRVIRRFYRECFDESGLTYSLTDDIITLIQTGKTSDRLLIGNGIFVTVIYDSLSFGTGAERSFEPIVLSDGIHLIDDHISVSATNVPDGVTVRPRRQGDEFRRKGRHCKSLKKTFIDEHIPSDIRNLIPVVEYSGQVIYVGGFGWSGDFKRENGFDISMNVIN